MSGAKSIVFAFTPFEESANAMQLSNGVEATLPAGKNFVKVRLMSNVPHQFILWRIENVVKGDCKFDGSQSGTEVAAGF